MRKIIINLLVCMLGFVYQGSDAYAIEVGEQEVILTVTESYATRYIWRGQDLYATDDPAHQPSIDIAFPELLFGTDVSFNIWGSFPLAQGHEDAEEFDYTITFSQDIFNGAVTLQEGYTYFDFPNTSSTAEVQEPWISFTLNKIPALPVDVYFMIFAGFDFEAASGGPDEGWYYSWGLGTELVLPSVPIFQEGQTLSLEIINWANDGVADLESSSLYATEISCSTSYNLGAASISPRLVYTVNHIDEVNSGDDEIWGYVELSFAL